MDSDYPSWGDVSGSQDIEPTDGPKKSNQLIGALTQPFDNIGSNLGRTYDNFSNGKILGGLADTYKLATDPTGGWGNAAKEKSDSDNSSSGSKSDDASNFNPTTHPGFFSSPDKNGLSAIMPDGMDFLKNAAGNYAPQAQAVPIPSIPNASPNSQGQPGIIGQGINNGISSGISSVIAAFI